MRSQAAAAGGGGCSGAMQETTLQPLSRQGSLYSLTLDEVQNQLGGCLGKPLGSMNLDELLKSVWTVEANQGSSMGIDTESTQSGTLAPLQKQPSFTLSRALSKKTVEEVWRDIQLGKSDNGDNHNERNEKRRKEDRDNGNPDRAPTLGEMTLEDFLYKAGVVTESPSMQKNDGQGHDLGVGLVNPGAPESAQWLMHFQLPSVQLPQSVLPVLVPGHHVVQQPVPVLASPFMDSPYGDAQMTVSPSSLLATSSDTQTPGGKRVARGDVVEKTVERRQKRMIKNRESAARSRARKQAYTHELENKVSRLEEENERLRRKLEAEKVLPSAPPAEPKNQLRRTSSSPI